MWQLIDVAKRTEVNALVIDVKDDRGYVLYRSRVPLAREIGAACKDAAFVERLNKIGVDPVCGTPAQFAQTMREDIAIWKEAVNAAGMR